MPIDPNAPNGVQTDVDPLSDEGLNLPEVGAEPQVDDPQVEAEPPKPQDFAGFKSSDELIKAHKDLQGLYSKSRSDIYQMQEQLRQLAPILKEYENLKGAPQKEEALDIPKFLENFIQGPDKAISGVATKAVEAAIKKFQSEQLTPLQQELQQLRNERQVDKFMADNPEISREDEDALVAIIQETPWIRGMQGSTYDKLDAALSVMLRKEPTRFSGREQPSQGQAGLKAIKQAASTIGGKPGTRARVQKDEFDEVLELDQQQRALWR